MAIHRPSNRAARGKGRVNRYVIVRSSISSLITAEPAISELSGTTIWSSSIQPSTVATSCAGGGFSSASRISEAIATGASEISAQRAVRRESSTRVKWVRSRSRVALISAIVQPTR